MREWRKLRALRHDVAAKSLVSLFSLDMSISRAPPTQETVGLGWLESAGARGKVLTGELGKACNCISPARRRARGQGWVGLVRENANVEAVVGVRPYPVGRCWGITSGKWSLFGHAFGVRDAGSSFNKKSSAFLSPHNPVPVQDLDLVHPPPPVHKLRAQNRTLHQHW